MLLCVFVFPSSKPSQSKSSHARLFVPSRWPLSFCLGRGWWGGRQSVCCSIVVAIPPSPWSSRRAERTHGAGVRRPAAAAGRASPLNSPSESELGSAAPGVACSPRLPVVRVSVVLQPKEITDIRDFLKRSRQPDAKCQSTTPNQQEGEWPGGRSCCDS